MWVPGNVRDRLAVADEIVGLGRAAANRELEFGGLAWRFIDLIELGETARADEALAAERAIAEELRQPEYSWYVGVHTAARLMMTGRFDEAAAVAEQALADGQEAHTETAFQMYGVVQLELANARGGLEALEPMLLSMVEQYPLIPAWRSGLVYVYGLLGREDDLRPHLDVLADDDFATLPFDANWPAGMVSLVVACALVCDRARLEVLYERLLPLRDTCITAGMPALHMGSCETVLALAAVALGRDIDADEHLARGLESNFAPTRQPGTCTPSSTSPGSCSGARRGSIAIGSRNSCATASPTAPTSAPHESSTPRARWRTRTESTLRPRLTDAAFRPRPAPASAASSR